MESLQKCEGECRSVAVLLAIAKEPAGREGRSHAVWVVVMYVDCLHHEIEYRGAILAT